MRDHRLFPGSSRPGASDGAFLRLDLGRRWTLSLDRGSFGMGGLCFAQQFVAFFGSHLSAPHHVLHEIPRTLDREAGDPGGGTDDILHGRRHFTASLTTDLLRPLGQLSDRILRIDRAVSG